jgi:uncharacterized protein YdcH (DUF465 family)
MADYSALKEELIEGDEHFRALYNEHQECEQRLEGINHKSLHSPEDEIEEKRIKLHKLRLKDEMESLLESRALAGAAS